MRMDLLEVVKGIAEQNRETESDNTKDFSKDTWKLNTVKDSQNTCVYICPYQTSEANN